MSKGIVAIVGKPNTGKSTLFNYLAGERISIVEDIPGVTRDRIYADTEWLGNSFTLIDTGGIEPISKDDLLKEMRNQAMIAIETANVIVFMVDIKTGLTDTDVDIANILRKSGKPIVLCVNKVDSFTKHQMDIYEFYNLGLGEPYPISAANAQGLGDLLDHIVKYLPNNEGEHEDEITTISIVGKPNVGKSSLLNKLANEDRSIVSDIPGTTRDAIHSVIKFDGDYYKIIDTAGLRRKSKIKENIERYSIIRTVSAVENSDITLLMIDAAEGITEQDAKIAGIAHDRGRGIIIVVNKWDKIEKNNKTMREFKEEIARKLSYLPYAPIVFISALTGSRIHTLFDSIKTVVSHQNLRIATGVLNEVLYDAMAMNQPPSDKGVRLKIFYMTQIAVKPPTFVLFVNNKDLMHFSYLRYIENRLRDSFGFIGTSLKMIIRERKEK